MLMRTRLWRGVGLLALLWVLIGCTPEPLPTPVITPLATRQASGDVRASGTVVSVQEVALSFSIAGRVDEALVSVGDVVDEGQALVRLEATEPAGAVAQAEAALAIAERERARLDVPPDADRVAAAEAAVRAAAAAVTQTLAARQAPSVGVTEAESASTRSGLAAAMADRRETFEIHEDTLTCVDVEGYGEVCPLLGPPEQAARYAWQAAEADLAAAEAEMAAVTPRGRAESRVADAALALARAQQALAVAQLGQARAPAMAEEVAVADAAVAEARAGLDAARAGVRLATLSAPMSGTVVDLSTEVGEIAQTGQSVISLSDLDNLRVETTDLSELDVGRVRPGQAVTIILEALEGREVTGVVASIAHRPETLGGDTVYPVTIDLDETPPELRMGMSVEVTIHVE